MHLAASEVCVCASSWPSESTAIPPCYTNSHSPIVRSWAFSFAEKKQHLGCGLQTFWERIWFARKTCTAPICAYVCVRVSFSGSSRPSEGHGTPILSFMESCQCWRLLLLLLLHCVSGTCFPYCRALIKSHSYASPAGTSQYHYSRCSSQPMIKQGKV